MTLARAELLSWARDVAESAGRYEAGHSPREATTMSELGRITTKPEQCGGRPCIRGLRVRVKDVLDLLAAGASRDEILADYPYLEAEDITAALQFAAKQTDHPVLRVV
jgi:uncharacterized protein (DUF433 family)